MTREKFPRLAEDPPRIRAVAYYYQSIEEPSVCSVGQQRQAIQDWAAEHDIEIMREFSQVGYYSQVRHCELDEMLRQWSPQGNEIVYVLALRMLRRRKEPRCKSADLTSSAGQYHQEFSAVYEGTCSS
jgi:DNA invertase Pin-like site-specific DNA recombinase